MENKKIIKKAATNIILLGLVSFFADISSEMVYPLIPLYLTTVFGATPTLVGIIEGIAESAASLLKVFSGYISDRYKHKKALAFCGYATGLIYKIALIFATSWVGILGARIIDRFGKGIRTAPRDVMISESAGKGETGKAFGIHKALDMAGSAIGIMLAFIILKTASGASYKTIFAVSVIPVVFALAMFIFIKEKKDGHEVKSREHFWKSARGLDGQLKLYLIVVFIFTLGNSSNTFLLLRATDIGFSNTDTILLYFVYNIVAALLAVAFGKRSDKKGRKKVLVAGYFTFAIVYAGFAFASSKITLVAVFVLYGAYTAMITGAERAFISEISPAELKGTMLGLHSTLTGIALLPASIIAGLLWDGIGSFAPFAFGSLLSVAAAVILIFGLKGNVKGS